MYKHTLLLLTAALTLSACASGAPPTPTPIPKPALKPAAKLTQKCPELPQPKTGLTQDLLVNHVQVAKLYHKCQENHEGLVDWMEKTQ